MSISDDSRKLVPVPKEIYGSTPSGSTSPTPTGKIQKLKNVSIQELKHDLEKSRAQQRQKMRAAGNGDIVTAETKAQAKVPPIGTQKPQAPSTLPVEQLDVSAPLDVTSVGSSAPTPAADKVVSFEEPSDKSLVEGTLSPTTDLKIKPGALAGASKGRGKVKKSVATVKLTELEIAKLGRLAQPPGQAGGKGRSGSKTTLGAPPASGKLSPRPTGQQRPSPKASPRPSPRPSPRGSPTRAASRVDSILEDDGKKKEVVRVPRKDIPTRREKFEEKQRAMKAGKGGKEMAAGSGKALVERGETVATEATQVDGDKPASSSDRSASRERAQGDRSSLTRETSKDKGKSGSRKASLMDGQSPASRATKNINDYGYKLVALCRKGDWVGVDTVIKFILKSNVEFDKDAASETTGWTPLMFAVRDNRIQIVEQLIDLGFNVNARAKVRPCLEFASLNKRECSI